MLGPIIYLNKLEQLTLAAVADCLRNNSLTGDSMNIEFAAAMITVVPVMVIFLWG